MRREEALAYELLKKYGVHKPPVPVEDIAKGEGAIIVRQHFEGSESGFTLRNDHQAIIGVNTRTSHKRQRFTIAHEIGHLKLGDGKPLIVDHSVRVDMRNDVSSIGTDAQEIAANAFGAALLMPHDFVIGHVKRFAAEIERTGRVLTRDQLVADLAREFDVSTEAMGFRLINLGILAA
jgi:Zn-dependent peptidase ImmA (M78 family)